MADDGPHSVGMSAFAESSAPAGEWLPSQVSVRAEVAGVRFHGVPAIPRLAGSYGLKRPLDVVLSAIAIAALLPLMICVWVAVVTTSRGPGIFWTPRIGRHGRVFLMPKFRTMNLGAPIGPRECMQDANCHLTPIGGFLRRWCLDELPQLFCILGGDMSFIGPRPLLATDPAALARHAFPAALSARPGLSGLAQIVGRNLVSPRRKARFDALYARRVSFWLDLEILLRTGVVLLAGRGFI